jgi:hypothetical protein
VNDAEPDAAAWTETLVILPKQLVLHASRYYMDGGTACLEATDEAGQPHAVMLVQSVFPGGNTFGIPGRLYLDEELVELRSEREAQVLALLRAAEVRYTPPTEQAGERVTLSPNALILGEDIKEVLSRGPEENIRGLRDRIVEFVESPRYVAFAAEVEQLRK